MLETNIDNMNQEIYSYIIPKLFDIGALDVFLTPVIMKKNRPGNILSVLCRINEVNIIEKFIFEETTTLGIRKYQVEREELDRKRIEIETKYGKLSVKAAFMDGKILKYSPEYEECAEKAKEYGITLKEIYAEVMCQAAKNIN